MIREFTLIALIFANILGVEQARDAVGRALANPGLQALPPSVREGQ
jgi:hypothetical protein